MTCWRSWPGGIRACTLFSSGERLERLALRARIPAVHVATLSRSRTAISWCYVYVLTTDYHSPFRCWPSFGPTLSSQHARDRNLSRNLVATRRSSCLHQAAYARHAVDAGSVCSIDSVSTSWPSLLSQTSFIVQRFPRQFLLYSCEERQVASARILVFQWRRRE